MNDWERCDCEDCRDNDLLFGFRTVTLSEGQQEAVARALKEFERAYTQAALMGDYSPEYVRERRAELLALPGIPEELWKEM